MATTFEKVAKIIADTSEIDIDKITPESQAAAKKLKEEAHLTAGVRKRAPIPSAQPPEAPPAQ